MSEINKTIQLSNDVDLNYPEIITSVASLNFTGVEVDDISASQSFILSGINMVGNLIISAPSNFIINTDNSNTNMSLLTIGNVGGIIPNTTIYVKFLPTDDMNYAGDITFTSTNMVPQILSLTGAPIALLSTTFGTVVQQLLLKPVGNLFLDKTGNGFDVDIINNDIALSKGFPYKSNALIAQKIANYGLIPDDNNFWFTAGVPNQIPVVSFFQNINYGNKIFCRHSAQQLDINGVETFEPRVSEIVTYFTALTGPNLTAANSYFGVPAIDGVAKWIDPVNGVDTNAGTQAAPYKLHSKVNGLTLTEGILAYVKTGTVAPIAWNKNYQIKTLGFTKILNSVSGRGIDYDPAGTLSQELNGYYIDMANFATSVGINCNSTVHPLTIKKFKIINATNSAIESVPFSTVLFSIDECVINNTNSKGVYSNKNLNITNSLINSSSFCLYKDGVNQTTINIINSKIINAGTPFRLYYLVNLTMTGGLLEWQSLAMMSVNASSGGERNYNGVNIKYTGTTVGGFITTESQSVTKLDIRNSKLECPNMSGFIGAQDINGVFNFINNIMYKTDPATIFAISVYQKNYSNRNTVVNISNNMIRSDAPISNGALTIGQDPHPYPNKITGVVEKNHFMHMNDSTAHGFIVLYENSGVTVRHNKINGLPVNGFKAHGDSYILNKWNYNLQLNAPMLAKGVTYGNFYNNTVVVNQYMPDSANLVSISSNALPGPLVNSTNCEFKNNIIAYTGIGGNMGMIRLDHPNNQINYNIYYNKNYPCKFIYVGVEKTFAEWQALGFDVNSVVLTDAEYNAMFEDTTNDNYAIKQSFTWPIVGVNTGATTGLDRTTTWGGSASTPNVVTKEQPVNWNIGAYIK
jgi:hypothetical protein